MIETVLTTRDYVGLIRYPGSRWNRWDELPEVVREAINTSRPEKQPLLIDMKVRRDGTRDYVSAMRHFDCSVNFRKGTTEADVVKDRTGVLPKRVFLSPGLYMQARRLAALIPE